ncbi:cytosine permease [Caballeronia sp. LZ025]|uniref:purine-cytosine permease family protein n=1 Tax=Caballeronia TaxID=1827195 RepID=UPI001FD5F0E5|nr:MULTISPECIES: cytosine permease [Caballeronia]MDR5733917.1 cytosine permease [Caballeronia sp. LZ025]
MLGNNTSHKNDGAIGVEQQTIYAVPAEARHGSFKDLFTIWFGSNINMLTIITGALGTTLFGLDTGSTLVAILAGTLLGGVLMALHAAQGPQLGVPQMIQTRGQFGAFGAIFVIAVVVFMYVGFFAANSVLGALSIAAALHVAHSGPILIAIGLISLAAAIYGYDLIHAYCRILTWVSGIALLAAFAWLLLVHGMPATTLAKGGFTITGFIGMLSIATLYQLGYAPYVSDYTRYMPADTGVKPAFWATYSGSALGSILPMILGALVGLVALKGDAVSGLVASMGAIALPIVIIFALSIACNNAMNLYCGTLSVITIVQTFRPQWKPRAGSRGAIGTVLFLAGMAVGLAATEDFMQNYENFILLLLYVLIPWTSINLVDYYLIHKGRYDVDAFFKPDGGIYGKYNAPALACYVIGILIEVPFVSNALYTGPVAKWLNGADISWLVGVLVISPVYYVLARQTGRHRKNLTAATVARVD